MQIRKWVACCCACMSKSPISNQHLDVIRIFHLSNQHNSFINSRSGPCWRYILKQDSGWHASTALAVLHFVLATTHVCMPRKGSRNVRASTQCAPALLREIKPRHNAQLGRQHLQQVALRLERNPVTGFPAAVLWSKTTYAKQLCLCKVSDFFLLVVQDAIT